MSFLPRANSHAWSVADQVLVSGCNFLIGISLARLLGLEAFGAYAIAQMYLMYANTFQQSLVSATMMTAVPAEPNAERRAILIRGFFGYSLLVLMVVTLGVQIAAWGLGQVSSSLHLSGVSLSFISAMLSFQLQDWLRRVLYVESNSRAVFISDVLAYGGQLAAVVLLGWKDALSVSTALWVVALVFGTSALFIVLLQGLLPNASATKEVLRSYGRSSRNMLVSSQLQWMGSSGVILLGAGFIGAQSAGAIRIAQTFLGPFNVIFQWMDNVIPVRAALQLREHGFAKLSAYLRRIGMAGVAAIAVFTLVLALVDEWLMVTVYGEAYRAFAILLVLQAVYYFFGHVYRMMSYLNRATGNTGALAKASVWWALVALSVSVWTVQKFADQGIMFALISGEVAALVYLSWMFFLNRKRTNE